MQDTDEPEVLLKRIPFSSPLRSTTYNQAATMRLLAETKLDMTTESTMKKLN